MNLLYHTSLTHQYTSAVLNIYNLVFVQSVNQGTWNFQVLPELYWKSFSVHWWNFLQNSLYMPKRNRQHNSRLILQVYIILTPVKYRIIKFAFYYALFFLKLPWHSCTILLARHKVCKQWFAVSTTLLFQLP